MKTNNLSVGITGFIPDSTDYKNNFKLLKQYIKNYSELDLICLPELYLISEPTSSNSVKVDLNNIYNEIDQLSNTYNMVISYGTILYEDDKQYIAQLISIPNEERIIYKKIHLGHNENKYFDAGEDIVSFTYKGINFGIQLCIETHIPELSLIHKLHNIDIILAPFRTPFDAQKRINIWKKYIPARSYEYKLIFICNNYYGGQILTNSKGEVVCSSTDNDIILHSLNIKEDTYSKTDYLKYRRPDIYKKYL